MILLTGASGFVGGKIMQMRKDIIPCPSLKGLNEDAVKRIVEESNADTIIHTAAVSDIGACQADPESSYLANVQLPVWLAKSAKNIKLICFSSDQVYSGTDADGPYTEDMAKPDNLYSKQKLEMEKRVLDIVPTAVMLRAEWMYDYYLKKSNYFMNILNAKEKLAVSSKQFRGLTYIKEVAENLDKVIALPGGTYNFGSETKKSMFEITQEFLAYIGKSLPIEQTPARHNLWMNCDKARAFGVNFSSVEDGLKRCAKDYQLL